MPKFRVVLHSQTDDHKRFTTAEAADADEARAICEAQEAELVAFELSDDDPILAAGEFTARGKVVGLGGQDKARFHAHHQELPYEVVSVEPVKRDLVAEAREAFVRGDIDAAELERRLGEALRGQED